MPARKKPRYDDSGIDSRVEEMRQGVTTYELEGLPLLFVERNLREAATLEAMMEGCKVSLKEDGLTKQQRSGAKNNRTIKMVPNENLDVYLKLLRTYIQVTGAITKSLKAATSAVAEEELDEFDAFNAV